MHFAQRMISELACERDQELYKMKIQKKVSARYPKWKEGEYAEQRKVSANEIE